MKHSVSSRRMTRSSSDRDALEDGFEETKPVGGAEQRIDRAFGVRHHAEHVAGLIYDTRDVTYRAVRIVRLFRLQLARRVAKDDLTLALQPIERSLVGTVAAVAVRDRQHDLLATFIPRGEQRLVRLHSQVDRRTDELQRRVSEQGTGKQPRLAGDLEAVAEAHHRRAALRVLHHLPHDRAEPCDRAGAEIVAVAEPAGEDDDVAALQIVVFVPEVGCLFAERLDDGLERVVVAVRAGKGHDSELHDGVTSAISKSSVTGLASRRSHISVVSRRAASASAASTSRTRCRPTCTAATPPKPSVCSASATALPWGSSSPRRGTT